MQSSLISKIEKARIYATEHERFQFTALTCTIQGDSAPHQAALSDDGWSCDCFFFQDAGTCAHTMAVERLLDQMLPERYRPPVPSP